MANIRCPLSGEQIRVQHTRSDSPGDTWKCPGCGEDITLHVNRRVYHRPGKWIACPANGENVFVWTDDNEDYECDQCDRTITVENGEIEHEPVDLVECPAFKGKTSLVPISEDAEYWCDHCKASIYVGSGEARHEAIEELQCTRQPHALVIVPLEKQDVLECPYCEGDIEVRDGEAFHASARGDVHAYCSWCFIRGDHELYRPVRLGRHVYQCRSCRQLTLKCRYCSNMATGPPDPDSRDRSKEGFWKSLSINWHSELCAEHDGTVASFDSLSQVLSDIEDYETLFTAKQVNLLRLGKIGAGILAGVIVIGPAVFFAAPGLAAALGASGMLGAAGTGTAISTLSGAALGSASLAAIGAGTMAGGLIVLTAAGASLGGVLGGVVSNAYFGQVRGFSIRKHNEGRGPAIIFANGFLTQKVDDPRDWKRALRHHFADAPWYHLTWEAKVRAEIGSLILRDSTGAAARRFVVHLAERAAKKAGGKLSPAAWVATAADLIGNPWHVAMKKAAMTGVLLADILARTRQQEFILMGHSLGARVIYYALTALSTKKDKAPVVRAAYLFGGAVGAGNECGWDAAATAVSGTIHNCYSRNDRILKILYQGASGMLSRPIGIDPITSASEKIKDWDFSDLVDGHNDWKTAFPELLRRIHAAQ
jgi:hypothetical protein